MVGTFGSVGSGRSLADAGHYGTHDGVDRFGWQRKASAFGNKLDSPSSAVNDHPAGLALPQVLLKMGSEVRTGGVVDVLPRFGHGVTAPTPPVCPCHDTTQ